MQANIMIYFCIMLSYKNNPELGRNYDIVTKGILGFKSGEHIIFTTYQ
jgi:toxin ParE1/3/4